MAETRTDLKEAVRKATTLGVLAEKKLEITQVNGSDIIKGSITLQTSAENFTTYEVYVAKLTKAGKENAAYKGLLTIMEEYKSLADVPKEEATIVYTNGKIDPQSYVGEQGKVERMRLSSSFFSRHVPKPDEDVQYESKFEVEVYITSIMPETYTSGEQQGEETGRVLVNGYVPLYNGGIEPIQLIAPVEDDIAEAVTDSYEVGQTVLFYGNINNTRHVDIREIPMQIGKPKIERKTTYRNEFIIEGASTPYEEAAAYSQEVIKNALTAREERLSKPKESAAQTSKKPASSGRRANW